MNCPKCGAEETYASRVSWKCGSMQVTTDTSTKVYQSFACVTRQRDNALAERDRLRQAIAEAMPSLKEAATFSERDGWGANLRAAIRRIEEVVK